MSRPRITAAFAAATLLLALAPAASATPAAVSSSASAIGGGVSTPDAPSERATPRQIRRALPTRGSLGRGVRSQSFRANAWCGATRVAGPLSTADAGAIYTDRRSFEFGIWAEEHRSVRTAKQRFRAVGRQVRQACNGFVLVGNELIPQRAAPLRRIGQQSAGIGFLLRSQATGSIIGDLDFSIHRIGRFVVIVNVREPSVEPRRYQRAMRQVETGLRRL
jgi:hypothetical protein